MAGEYPYYRPRLFDTPKPVGEVGATFAPTFFLPVTLNTVALIRGALSWFLETGVWQGTESEIEEVFEVIMSQRATPVMTQAEVCGMPEPMGASFRFNGGYIEVMQDLDLPPPEWEFRGTEQEDGSILIEYRTIPE